MEPRLTVKPLAKYFRQIPTETSGAYPLAHKFQMLLQVGTTISSSSAVVLLGQEMPPGRKPCQSLATSSISLLSRLTVLRCLWSIPESSRFLRFVQFCSGGWYCTSYLFSRGWKQEPGSLLSAVSSSLILLMVLNDFFKSYLEYGWFYFWRSLISLLTTELLLTWVNCCYNPSVWASRAQTLSPPVRPVTDVPDWLVALVVYSE